MRLERASLKAPKGPLEFIREIGEGEAGFAGEPAAVSGPLADAADVTADHTALQTLLERLVAMAEGRDLPADRVPMTTYWLVDDAGSIVAMSRLRHRLTPFLLNHGGHIGYYVARGERAKGYGTQILALTLKEARHLGLDRALLTVDSDNAPSIAVIERNEGRLEDEGIDPESGKLHRRYWIDLGR